MSQYYIKTFPSKDAQSIICEIEVEGLKSGLKIKIQPGMDFDMLTFWLKQAKKQLSRHIFLKHKIVIENYEPSYTDFFSSSKTLKKVISKKYMKRELFNMVKKNGFEDYFHLVPECFYRDSK